MGSPQSCNAGIWKSRGKSKLPTVQSYLPPHRYCPNSQRSAGLMQIYKVIRTHYMSKSPRPKVLGIFANRIDAVYFAEMCFDGPDQLLTRCHVAPRIPEKGGHLPDGILLPGPGQDA